MQSTMKINKKVQFEILFRLIRDFNKFKQKLETPPKTSISEKNFIILGFVESYSYDDHDVWNC